VKIGLVFPPAATLRSLTVTRADHTPAIPTITVVVVRVVVAIAP
jgi:hypothetical protein